MLHSIPSVKLLGVNIDYAMNFNIHVTEICKKAGRHLNALSRLSIILNTDEKMKLFECFILSHFNFCPLVWHWCSVSDMKKIENVQKRALRHVYKDYTCSYHDLLEKAGKPLLYIHRLKLIVSEVYKIINHIGPKYLHDMFVEKSCKYSLRKKSILDQPRVHSVTQGKNTFRYEGTVLWNMLPNDMKDAANFNVFKRFIMNWEGPNCECRNCKLCSLTSLL